MLVPMLEKREGKNDRTMLETHSWPPHTQPVTSQASDKQTRRSGCYSLLKCKLVMTWVPQWLYVVPVLDRKNVCSIKEGPQDDCLYQVVTTLLREADGISVASLALHNSHWGSQGSEAMSMNMEHVRRKRRQAHSTESS